jgi:NRPS condensation-like uncharacterized protein
MTTFPLTPVEEFLLWEDRPSYPWIVAVRVRFVGRLDRASVETALMTVVRRHPLLSSTIELRGKRWYWIPAEPKPAITWSEVDQLSDDHPQFAPMNLQNEIGVRFHVVVGSQMSDIIAHFHHGSSDGAGFVSFLNDFLIAYALERGESSPEVRLPTLDLDWLANRGRYDLTPWKFLKMLPRQLVGLKGAKQFMQRQPVPVAPHVARPDDDLPPAGCPSVIRHSFSEDETTRLRQFATRCQVTINEVLTRDLFLALMRWRQEHGFGSEHEWLRMMVPINMRSRDNRDLPAANVVSSIFLDRCGHEASDPSQLLQSIHDEMEVIKNNQLGLTFVLSLRLCQWLPGGLRKQSRSDRCSISCIFSNLGRILLRSPLPKRGGHLVVGDVSMESFQLVPPLRPYNCTTFFSSEYAGRLAVDLHYDPDFLTAVQSRRVMDLYIEQAGASSARI